MRLIDADELIEKINELAEGNEDYKQRYIALLAARGLVQDAPTVYNPEKVVEELEKLPRDSSWNHNSNNINRSNAIDIVKRGGVE